MTIVHELGHALGLKHPHEEFFFSRLAGRFDALEFSVMSYRTFVGDDLAGYDAEGWSFPQTYMMLDIAALQHMYGADFETRAGDTTYAWSPGSGDTLVDGEVAIAPGGNRIFLTLWDGGGADCYDLSAYASGVSVDLAPGRSSVFARDQLADLGGGPNGGAARGNLYNALSYQDDRRSLIEDAEGGAGHDDALYGRVGRDLLVGGAGADLLVGGKGADLLLGGPGADVFLFTAARAAGALCDVIGEVRGVAFEGPGSAAGDLIDLSGIDTDLARDGDQAFAFAGKGPGRLVLREADGDTMVCGDTDGSRGFEFLLAIEDGAIRAEHYGAEDFVL
jgi:serralysin